MRHQKETKAMNKFEIGNTYSMRSICDHECVWTYTVVARTEQTITLMDERVKASNGTETIKCRVNKKVSEWNNAETVYPLGRYSMCPSLTA
jgi:hypothetical protein